MMYHVVHIAQMDEVKYVRAFAQQLDKRVGKYFFQITTFGDQAIKKHGDEYGQDVIIGDDAQWIMQAC